MDNATRIAIDKEYLADMANAIHEAWPVGKHSAAKAAATPGTPGTEKAQQADEGVWSYSNGHTIEKIAGRTLIW